MFESKPVDKDFEGFCVTNEKIYSFITCTKILLTRSLNKSEPCYSKCSQWTSSINITWKLVRNSNSQTHWIRISVGVAQESIFKQILKVTFMFTKVVEALRQTNLISKKYWIKYVPIVHSLQDRKIAKMVLTQVSMRLVVTTMVRYKRWEKISVGYIREMYEHLLGLE